MRTLMISAALAGLACAPIAASAQAVDDPFSDYLQRSDKILLGAGNAPESNAIVHTITPWPPYVGNTRIVIDGQRSVDAVEQMHRVPNPFARQSGENPVGGTGTGPGPSSANGPGSSSLGSAQSGSAGY